MIYIKRFRLFSISFIIFIATAAVSVHAQCMMQPIDVKDQVAASSLIVEGEVMSQRCFSSPKMANIYTAYTIRITKIFKGTLRLSEIEIVRNGGQFEGVVEQVTPTVELEVGEIGTFMLTALNSFIEKSLPASRSSSNMYSCYANAQSVFKYDMVDDEVTGVFISRKSRESEWYSLLERTTSRSFIELSALQEERFASRSMVPAISALSPTTITAGTLSELTISGSGFGSTRGSSVVQFKFADDGGTAWYSASALHYVSWSDVSIVVLVPTKAGTGQVRAVVGGVASSPSAASLTINYAESTFEDNGFLAQFQHANVGGSGGYVFRYFTDFANNASAVASFERALKTWQCDARVNITIGANTGVDASINDDINVVRFDNGGELGAGTLAQARVRLNCYSGALQKGPAEEIDILFDDGTTWEYGPSLPSGSEIDFESVALHELGHATILNHVINSAEVMHFSTATGLYNRTLSTHDLAGAADVYVRSTQFNFSACLGVNGASTFYDPMPIALCQDITVDLGTSNFDIISASEVNAGSSSSCGSAISINQTYFDCFSHVGANTVTLTVTDQGNGGVTATCAAGVFVTESIPPTVSCKNNLVQLGASNTIGIPPSLIDNGTSDNCVVPSKSVSIPVANTSHIGANIITYTATDNSGNSASCTATLYVYPYSKVLYVHAGASGNNSGESWGNAIPFLADALLVAEKGNVDTIKIAQGIYYPDNGFFKTNDDRTEAFEIRSQVVIIGGYDAATGLRNIAENPTVLSGDIQQDANTTNNSYSVVINDFTGFVSTLDGLVVERGNANGSSPNPYRTGGGIYNARSLHIRNCIFRNNECGVSSGIGGAIISFNGPMTVDNCLFHDNSAQWLGGAVAAENGIFNLNNCTFSNNTASNGGAIHAFQGTVNIKNNIYTNNAGTNKDINDGTPGASGTVTISNTLFDGALPINVTDGGGNLINSNPTYADQTNKNFTLLYGSPGINAGGPIASLPAIDLNNNQRLLGSALDLGPYEFNYKFPCGIYASLMVDDIPVYAGEYKASGQISSTGTINNLSTGPVIYNSTNSIQLSDGFLVDLGQQFDAIIENPCVD